MSAALISGLVRASLVCPVPWGLAYFRASVTCPQSLSAPAFVCSVGSRVVVMDASRFGMRCSFIGSPIKPPSGYAFALVDAVAPSLMTCGHRQEKQRRFPPALPISFQDEWGRLLASLARPVFAQFADDGQWRVVVQVKREWLGLVLLGGGVRVHSWGAGAQPVGQCQIMGEQRPA